MDISISSKAVKAVFWRVLNGLKKAPPVLARIGVIRLQGSPKAALVVL